MAVLALTARAGARAAPPARVTAPRHRALAGLRAAPPARRAPGRGRARTAPVAALPALAPLAARVAASFALFFFSMNWVYARGMRKDVQKAVEKREEEKKAQHEKLDQLEGKK
jgi:hypothetical protein